MPYVPSRPTTIASLADLREYIDYELQAIAKEFGETIALELRQVDRAPDKPREGMIVSADGTNWNPGAGKGAYEYKAGVWVKL